MLLLKCSFTSTETVGLLGTGAQDGHLDFHTAPELGVCVGVNWVDGCKLGECVGGYVAHGVVSLCVPGGFVKLEKRARPAFVRRTVSNVSQCSSRLLWSSTCM